MITGSQIERIKACAYSETRPHTHATSEAAQRGIAVHRFLELCVRIGHEKALAEIEREHPAHAEFCALIDFKSIRIMPGSELEMGLVWNAETGHVRMNAGRSHGYGNIDPYEIAATLDMVSGDSGAVYVTDYKTGQSTPAKNNQQIRFGCMAVAKLHGKTHAYGCVIRITPEGKIEPDEYQFDDGELKDIEIEMVKLVRDVAMTRDGDSHPEPAEGDHCRFCPAWLSCEAKHRTLAMFRNSGDELTITKENAANVYRRMRDVEDVVKRVKGALAQYTEAEGALDVSTGRVYGTHEVDRKELDARVVFDVVSATYGVEAGMVAADITTTTQAAIERALKGKAINMAQAKRDVLAKIEATGGVKITKQTRVEEWKK